MDAQRFQDLLQFGTLLMATKDNDPVYYLLSEVIRTEGLDDDQAHWLVWCYLTFYNVSSAWAVFTEFPKQTVTTPSLARWEQEHRKQLHINIERRGFRGGKWLEAWASVPTEPFQEWLDTPTSLTPVERYEVLWERTQTLPYVGRWAAFKFGDLAQYVLDYKIEAPDMRMAYCSGPRHALEELYLGEVSERQDPSYIEYLDGLGNQLRDALAAVGLVVNFSELETICCNFYSTMHGRYFCGHDWDEGLHDVLQGLGRQEPWMKARAVVAPSPKLLGEVGGWTGVRKPLKTLYRDKRIIFNPLEI